MAVPSAPSRRLTVATRSKAKLPWSVKGVTPESRDLAKSAAADHEATMGEWLSHVIRRVGAAEASGRPLTPAESLQDIGDDGDGTGRSLVSGGAQGVVEDAALIAGVHQRLERSEARLLDVLDGLEDVVEKLADRIGRLERRTHGRD
ncbi:localization factor PodJL [Thalassobaculum litoreum DSM 18839]|uniref:Localization factor PodJL n=1 Tax=Thalassobaculum litoreum DSM 18839 TaxID=1123362 RepID=A0A8G2BJY7_9PROT|nr:localization factor PodJL [Thalassobaculum litoreum DSM 18839]